MNMMGTKSHYNLEKISNKKNDNYLVAHY